MISKHVKLFILIICSVVCFTDNSFSEVLRARCPFSCQTQNLPRQFCKDWQKGDTCYIDVVGRVVKRICPFTCRTEGINKTDCRDWRQGDVCFIHDLRKNSPYRSNINEFEEYHHRHHDRSHDDYKRVPPRDYYYDYDSRRHEPPRDHFRAPDFPKKPAPAPNPPAPNPAPRKTTGKVTKKPCPYSCRTEGIPKNKCRDWKEGGLCVIERL